MKMGMIATVAGDFAFLSSIIYSIPPHGATHVHVLV